jgi:predicted dehydrogenase
MTDTSRLTAAVVGGGSGGRLSLDALTASDRYDLVAAADISPSAREALAARYPGLRLFAEHREMFAEAPVDVVCVSTWPPSHREVATDALALPGLRGLLCEKPIGHIAADGRAILDAVRARGLPIVVPHGLLVARHGEEILRRVRDDEIGDLDLVEIECSRWDIMNAGIHWLNYFVNLVPGDPMAWVMAIAEASTQTYRDGVQVETTAITYVQTQGGVRAVMHTGDDVVTRSGKGTVFRLVGTGGAIEFWAWESAYRLLNAAHPRGEVFQVTPYPVSNHQRYLDALAVQIEAGSADYTLPETSLVALELCEGAYLASAHRCKVTLPLADFAPPPEPDWHPGQPYDGRGGRDGRRL